MKIRVAIIDTDEQYLGRVITAFHNIYADKLEIYSFTTDEAAYQVLKQQRVDVILASDSIRIETERVPSHCGFAYLTENTGIDMIEGQSAICKYQKIDFIYKTILGLYAENAGAIGSHLNGDMAPIIAFFSVNGGAGSSTIAAAIALQMAKAGKRILYLNVEQTGSGNLYFQAPGEGSFSDIIYLLKSRRANISLKIQSMIKQTAEGVYFFDDCVQAMDMLELTAEEFEKLAGVLQASGLFDQIILDLGSVLSGIIFQAFQVSAKIVCISDGSETCKTKFQKLIEILEIKEREKDIPLIPKISVVYNKFSNKSGIGIDMERYPVLGGAPRYEGINTRQIMERLSKSIRIDL